MCLGWLVLNVANHSARIGAQSLNPTWTPSQLRRCAARHLQRVNRQGVPEVRLSTEVLPVGILYPKRDHFFIRKIEGVVR